MLINVHFSQLSSPPYDVAQIVLQQNFKRDGDRDKVDLLIIVTHGPNVPVTQIFITHHKVEM